MKLDVKFTGNKEIDACFRGLPGVLQDKVMQDAHARALQFTVQKAKLIAPEGPTGNLIDSIGIIRAPKKGRTEMGLVYAGPRRGGKNKGYHAHMVEFGTKQRRNKKGANRGKMNPDPFMEPAWDQTRPLVLGVLPVEYGRKLVAFMKRTLKNAGK